MNKARRKQIEEAAALVASAIEILSTVRDEEQEAYENLPESLQSSERGEAMSAHGDNLDQIVDELEALDFDQFAD